MKKIVMAFTLTPTDDSVTEQSVREALRLLGTLQVISSDEVVVEEKTEAMTRQVVLFVSADEDDPYQLVAGHGDRGGRDLTENEIESLRYFGVCTGFYGTYPDADKYGVPRFASDDVYAETIVAEHRFPVCSDGLDVQSEDSGDDGMEAIWLTISIPETLYEGLMAAESEVD